MAVKRFLVRLVLFMGAPVMVLLGVYLWTDPFRCLHPFDLSDTDQTNREYFSTELFLKNYKQQQYNSFVFGSSRVSGMNSYRWKTFLSGQPRPFVFQAWNETLTGMELKLDYLDRNRVPLDNVLILLDVPGAFDRKQLPRDVLSLKHFVFTGKNRCSYNAAQFFNFLQKPSLWVSSVKKTIKKERSYCVSDTISNDWDNRCRYLCDGIPAQDSLNGCSVASRNAFLHQIANLTEDDIEVSKPLITAPFEEKLRHIKSVLDRNHTDYYVIVTPAYCYTHLSINPNDLETLQVIFGDKRVFDFTGKNEMTEDYNNFSDPNHFGQRVGWMILNQVYGL